MNIVTPSGDHDRKNAIVFLAMLGDKYIPGIIASVHSARKFGFVGDAICMIHGVSDESIAEMEKARILVKYVSLITHEPKYATKLQRDRYSSWIKHSFTKWNCLAYSEYHKILFLDADTLVIGSLDHIFKMSAPCSRFDNNLLNKKSAKKYKRKKVTDPSRFYKKPGTTILPVGSAIQDKSINSALHSMGVVATAQAVLIEPDEEDFEAYKDMLMKWENSKGSVGFKSLFTPDEQTISYFYGPYNRGRTVNKFDPDISRESNKSGPQKLKKWTSMGEINVLASTWDLSEHQRIYERLPTIVHYMNNPKPWEDECNKWPDLSIWWSMFNDAVISYELDPSAMEMRSDQSDCVIDTCFICETIGLTPDHNPLTCPKLFPGSN